MDSHDNPAHDPARRWQAILAQALESLRKEYVENGREALYECLKVFLSEQASFAEIAAKLGMTEKAVGVAVHRFRCRFSELVRKEAPQKPAGPIVNGGRREMTRLYRWADQQQLVILEVQSYDPDTPVRGQIYKHRIRARFLDGTIRTGWVQFPPIWPGGLPSDPEVRWEQEPGG